MIAPIHAGAGALISRAFRGRWTRRIAVLPLAFFSHQVLDWANPYLQHYLPSRLDLWIGIPGTIIIFLAVIKPWHRNIWKAWHWRHVPAMVVAMSPDIVDWVMLRPLGQPAYIHQFFWSKDWLTPWVAVVWLVLAIAGLAYLLGKSRQKWWQA